MSVTLFVGPLAEHGRDQCLEVLVMYEGQVLLILGGVRVSHAFVEILAETRGWSRARSLESNFILQSAPLAPCRHSPARAGASRSVRIDPIWSHKPWAAVAQMVEVSCLVQSLGSQVIEDGSNQLLARAPSDQPWAAAFTREPFDEDHVELGHGFRLP